MSTIRPDVAVRVAEAGRKAGLRVLDAPVSGGEAGAIEGSLSIMVGGEPADFEAAQPVLDAVGKTIVHVGPAGLRADRQGREPADRRRQHPAARRGGRLPRGVRRGHEGRAGGARRRPGRQHRAEPQGREHARPRVHARLPARPAPQGHGDRHLRRPRGRRRHPARRGRRPAHRRPGRARRRRPRPLRPAEARHRAVRPFRLDTRRRSRHGSDDGRGRRGRDHAEGRGDARVRRPRRGDQPAATRRCAGAGRSTTCSPGTSRAPRTWPRATPAPAPATSASASARPAPRART